MNKKDRLKTYCPLCNLKLNYVSCDKTINLSFDSEKPTSVPHYKYNMCSNYLNQLETIDIFLGQGLNVEICLDNFDCVVFQKTKGNWKQIFTITNFINLDILYQDDITNIILNKIKLLISFI